MASASYVNDFGLISGFESTASMSAYGGGASGLGASPDYKIQGTNAVDKQVSASEKGFMYTGGSVTMGPILPKDHYWIWLVCAVPGLTDTRNNRGIHVSIGDDTSNFVKFHVAGGDTRPRGGIAPYAIRFDNTTLTNRRTLVGSPGTTPTAIGGGANVTGTAKFSNFACDFAQIGTGYSVTGGTTPDAAATFDGLNNSVANPVFGLIDGAFQWQGKIRIGESGTECRFTDSNKSIFIVNTLDGHVQSDFNEIIVSDDSTVFTLTNITFTALGTHSPGRLENVTPLITGQDETSYDNSPSTEGTFTGGTGYVVNDDIYLDDGFTKVTVDAVSSGVVTQFTVDSTKGRSAVAGTAMTQSLVLDSLGQLATGRSGFTLTPDTDNILGAATLTFVNVGFIGFGDTILSANDSLTGCRWIGCDQVTANGATLSDSNFVGYEGTANTSYLIWNVNSDPDGKLDGCSFTKGTAATHAIEFGQNSPTTMTIRDMTFTSYNANDANNDSTFHFKRTTGDVTLNLINCTGNFSYRTDGANITIVEDPVDLTITVSDIGTNEPIQSVRTLIAAGSYVVDQYGVANDSASHKLSSADGFSVGQSFKGDGRFIKSASFYLSKTGSPTGFASIGLYDHSGTFGTSSVANGLLQGGGTLDVSTLTGTKTLVTITFGTPYFMENNQPYVIAVSYTGGDASNYINVGIDNTSPTHEGNSSSESTLSVWSSGTDDVIFSVNGDGLPFDEPVTSITRSGTTATVTRNAHGYKAGEKTLIEGANQNEYNGIKTITAVTANTFDYTVSGSPTTPATGTITDTFVLISAETDVNGQVTTNRSYVGNQPILGRTRKSSTSPLYKTQPIVGTIGQKTGLDISVQLVRDE